MFISDKVSGTMLVGLGAAAAYGGSLLPPVPGQQVGPNVFPMVVGAGLMLCGGMIALGVGSALEREAEADLAAHSDTPKPAASRSPLVNGAKTLLPPALLLGYVFVGDALGFVPTAFFIVLAISLAMGARREARAAAGADRAGDRAPDLRQTAPRAVAAGLAADAMVKRAAC